MTRKKQAAPPVDADSAAGTSKQPELTTQEAASQGAAEAPRQLARTDGMTSRTSLVECSDQIVELAKALVDVQAALEPVKKDTENPYFRSRYADLASIIEAIRPVLAEHQIAVLQFPGASVPLGTVRQTNSDGVVEEVPIGAIGMTTMLLHNSGQFMCASLSMPFLLKGAQAAGSAITYARRYGLQSILGIAAEDDDGNGAGASRVPLGDTDVCPVHKVPWVHRVGNYKDDHPTKAGQPYDFWSCPEKVDGKYCQQRPPQGYAGPGTTRANGEGQSGDKEPSGRVALLNAFESEVKRLGGGRLDCLRAWVAGADLDREVKSPNDLSDEELTACIAWLKEQDGGDQ